jgi:hypothetical protein
MKKIYYIVLIFLLGGMIISCEDKLDELYNNPNNYTPDPEEVVSGLFTHMEKTRFWQRDYGEWYWMYTDFDGMPALIQLMAGRNNIASATVNGDDDKPLKNSFGTDSLVWNTLNPVYNSRFADINYGDPTRAIGGGTNKNDRNRFDWFYTNLTNYPLIQLEVSQASGVNYDNTVVYARLATVLKDVVALQTVDLFNKIPYKEAFKGAEAVFFTPYDDPREIYHSVIEEYAEIAQELPGLYAKMSETAKTTFSKQDLFFKGDINKWVQYVNAQILRSCVRISGVDADYVKPFLTEAIKNLPQEDFTFAARELNQCRWGSSGNGGIYQRGIYDAWGGCFAIPDVILVRMNRGSVKYEAGTDDPRLPAIAMGFTPTGNTDDVEYYGMSGNYIRNTKVMLHEPTTPGVSLLGEPVRKNLYPQDGQNRTDRNAVHLRNLSNGTPDEFVKGTPWTYYNPITYVVSETPFNIETRSEIDLFLAEVALKSLASTGKSAGDHIQDAVLHSVDYWYMINGSGPDSYVTEKVAFSDLAKAILKPTKNVVAAMQYAGIIKDEFNAASGEDGKMEIIMQQKYIHLNLHGPYELFAELRRTRHPKLEPITSYASGSLSGAPALNNATMVFERYRYPDSERANNAEEFAKVSADDNWTTPIFWANKSTEPYFLPKALKD